MMRDELLESFGLLRDLGAVERIALGKFLEERHLEQGEVLFRAGQEAAEMLLIAEGSIKLEDRGAGLGLAAAGDMLGGASLTCIGRRQCDAIAAEPTRVLALEREGYLRLRADFPTIALALQEALLRELAVCVRAALDASPPEAPPTDQRAVGPLVGQRGEAERRQAAPSGAARSEP
jgi:CRP-like cAMP-binding protein